MDFGLSDEQELLQDTVRSFVANECPASRVRELFDGEAAFDATLWKGLAEIGLTGLVVPERYGGVELELLDLALAAEVLGEGGLPGPFLGHALATLALTLGGSEAQKELWLGPLACGDAVASIAFAEAEGLWQPDEWRAAVEGERLRGTKLLVPHGSLADVIVVGAAGGRLALVERDAPGVDAAPFESVDRTRRVDTLRLDGAPCDLLPGGVEIAGRVRDAGLVLLAADSFGCGWHLLNETIAYLSTREQFNTPLTQFQGIKHQIANLATELEPARSLYWYAAHAFDHLPEESERMAAIAKAHITDRTMEVAREVVELHGGIGFTWECDVQIWYKRAMFNRAFLGNPDAQRERSAQLAGW